MAKKKRPKQPRLDLKVSPEDRQTDAPASVVEVLDELEPRQKEVLTQWFEIAISGPLPPPQVLDGYDQIITNGADRIMEMAEREQAHRHKHDDKNSDRIDRWVDNEITLSLRGQGGGMFVMVILVIGALVFAYLDRLPIALATFLGGVAVQVGSWVLNRSARSQAPSKEPKDQPKAQ